MNSHPSDKHFVPLTRILLDYFCLPGAYHTKFPYIRFICTHWISYAHAPLSLLLMPASQPNQLYHTFCLLSIHTSTHISILCRERQSMDCKCASVYNPLHVTLPGAYKAKTTCITTTSFLLTLSFQSINLSLLHHSDYNASYDSDSDSAPADVTDDYW